MIASNLSPAVRALSVAGAAVPGCVAVVVRGDELDVTCAGVRNIDTGGEVDEHTVFHLASVSKIFTSLTVLALAQRRRVRLDERLEAQVAGLRFRDRRGAGITVRQVLTHTAGMPDNHVWSWPVVRLDDDAPRAVVEAANDLPLIASPGERHAYSNIGFDLLAALVTSATETAFEEAVRAEVLTPLGMTGSSLRLDEVRDRIAAPHVPHTFDPATFASAPMLAPREGDRTRVFTPYPFNRARAAGGNVLASGRDLARFLRSALRGFPEILSPASWSEMSARAVETGKAEPWYGLGLRVGHDTCGHGGLELGFRCGVQWRPSRGEAVGVLTNHFHGQTLDMLRAALGS
ncbi:MAG: serine hydrolase domain-containing protein [Myxococcales bacterium]